MPEKKLILTLSDHPLSPSGVGTQASIVIRALLKTGRFRVLSYGGAIKHKSYQPIKVEEFGDDWIIIPVDGYGTQEMVRSIVRKERPDVIWCQTDPRFWGFLWLIEQEIRPMVPLVYYTVWDNLPLPTFNRPYYLSNDYIASISKLTQDIVEKVAPEVPSSHLPHAVNNDIFKPLPKSDVARFRRESISSSKQTYNPDKLIFFWNNRNARRKQSGTLIFWFKAFLDEVGHDKAMLIMHTEPKDDNGQDLQAIIEELNLTDGQVLLSAEKVDQPTLAQIYNMADCTINIADAEGFGLSSTESMSCGTPVINNLTGGLQDQIGKGKLCGGLGIKPVSKAIIGSQEVPWIYEDRLCERDFVKTLKKFLDMSQAERDAMGGRARANVMANFSFKRYEEQWVEVVDKVIEDNGSWETRKNYVGHTFKEIK